MKIGLHIDRALGVLAPQWAARRVAARARFEAAVALATYEAAKKRRVEKDWGVANSSAEGALGGDLLTLLARARAAGRDSWAGVSIKDAWRRKVVGTGITPRASAKDNAGNFLRDFNRAIDAEWYEWARTPEWCDQERGKTLLMKQRLWIDELVEAGEVLILLNSEPASDHVGLLLQEIEVEQLDTTITQFGRNEVRSGIEIDDFGAAVAYHLHAGKHPLDMYSSTPARVPADRVLHLFEPRRVRQTHGVTRLHAVLRTMRHGAMYGEYELVKARAQAALIGLITSGADLATTSPVGTGLLSGQTGKDARSNVEINMEPGVWPHLAPGEDVKFPPPSSPNSTFGPYTQELTKQSAAGSGMDGATVSRDFTGGNFSTQRMNRIETYEETDPVQQLLIDVALRPTREEFVTMAVMQGRVQAPAFFSDVLRRRAYLSCSWQGPAKMPVDEANHAAAIKVLQEKGFTNYQIVLNELGLDWREVLEQWAEESAYAKELGITIPGLNAPAKVAPQEPRPTKKRKGEEEPAEDEEEGDLGRRLVKREVLDAVFQ
jgi:lambda family phage portal protein